MASPFVVVSVAATSLLLGLVPGVLARLRRPLAERLAVPEPKLALVETGSALLMILLYPLAGLLVDHEGAQELLFFGVILAAVGFTLAGLAKQYVSAALAYAALGAAGAALTPATIVVMPRAFASDDKPLIYPALNLGFVLVGFGLFLLAPLVDRLGRRYGAQRTFPGLALLCLLPAVCIPLTPAADFPVPQPAPAGTAVWGEPTFLLLALAVFFYFVLERSLEFWTRPFLEQLSLPGGNPQSTMIGFWVLFLLVRLVERWIVVPGYELWATLGFVLASVIILGNLVGAYAPNSGRIGFWCVGGCYGPILPALLGAGLDLEPLAGGPGLVVGSLFALAFVNQVTIRPIYAAYARSHTLRQAMWVPLVITILLAAPLLVLAILPR